MKDVCTTEMRVLKNMPDGHRLSWCKSITVVIVPHFTKSRSLVSYNYTEANFARGQNHSGNLKYSRI